jgi:threonine/homoserine/homoserine lactone efflux protein
MHVDPLVSLLSILGALILGCISPGPSFVFVTRTAVALSRRDGIAAALGMGLGAATIVMLSQVYLCSRWRARHARPATDLRGRPGSCLSTV